MAGVRGPKPPQITLSKVDQEQLRSWSRRRTTAAGLATRSRIVLAAAEGKSNSAIAAELNVRRSRRGGPGSPSTAWKASLTNPDLAGRGR